MTCCLLGQGSAAAPEIASLVSIQTVAVWEGVKGTQMDVRDLYKPCHVVQPVL